jgi:pSer/pThr/pTyr-binding forkhead associated (FHA) protein
MKLSLVVLSQGKEGQTIPITLSQFLIGRDPQCQLRPASPVISKRHCAVLVKNGKVVLRDFGSTNGTFVNDEPVKEEKELHNGDVLKVGPLTFRVVMEVTTPAPVNKPTPPPKPKAEAASPAEKAPPVKPQPTPAGASSDDDDVAAMLLALQDDGVVFPTSASEVQIPEGTTEMDIPTLPPGQQPAGTAPGGEAKPQDKKDQPPKKENVSSSSAAAALLQRMARRNRGG